MPASFQTPDLLATLHENKLTVYTLRLRRYKWALRFCDILAGLWDVNQQLPEFAEALHVIKMELHFELTTVGMSRLASAANYKRRPLVPGPLAGVYEKTIDGVPGLSYPVSSAP